MPICAVRCLPSPTRRIFAAASNWCVISHYPSFEEVSGRYAELRQRNLAFLGSFSDVDLDKATPFQPKGLEEHFANYERALLTLAVHQAMHRGQVTGAIRAAGRAGAVPMRVSAAA